MLALKKAFISFSRDEKLKTRGLTPILQPLLLSIGGVNQNRAAQKGTNRSRSIELEYYVLILCLFHIFRGFSFLILHSILALHCLSLEREVACRDIEREEREIKILHGVCFLSFRLMLL